jgi:hypothetical protein
MWSDIGRWVVILFGLFFMAIGVWMLIRPSAARATLRKAGSTQLINYGEITLRMIPAVGLILAADISLVPTIFKAFGWFMLLTSLVLYFVPPTLHHSFSNKSADLLKTIYIQCIAPISMLIGVLLIYCVY